jgi:hypothetical protein
MLLAEDIQSAVNSNVEVTADGVRRYVTAVWTGGCFMLRNTTRSTMKKEAADTASVLRYTQAYTSWLVEHELCPTAAV